MYLRERATISPWSHTGNLREPGFYDFASRFELIKVVTPPLGHSHPFVPVFAPMVDAAHRIAVPMRQGTFNCIRVPKARLIQER